MLFDKVVKRITPMPEPKEICELLLGKVPCEYNDIVTDIEKQQPCFGYEPPQACLSLDTVE